MKEGDLQRLRAFHKALSRKRGTKRLTIFQFYGRYFTAFMLLDVGVSFSDYADAKQAARRNFIVNLVTLLEGFLKGLIREHKNKWSKKGIADLLKDKGNISINEAIELFREDNVDDEHIIIYFGNFQNLQKIAATFSKLTNSVSAERFLDAIGNCSARRIVLFGRGESKQILLNEKNKNWQNDLMKLFDLRNQIIHEGEARRLTGNDITNYRTVVEEFVTVLNVFCKAKDFAKGVELEDSIFSSPE
jgi:hypothetical protein